MPAVDTVLVDVAVVLNNHTLDMGPTIFALGVLGIWFVVPRTRTHPVVHFAAVVGAFLFAAAVGPWAVSGNGWCSSTLECHGRRTWSLLGPTTVMVFLNAWLLTGWRSSSSANNSAPITAPIGPKSVRILSVLTVFGLLFAFRLLNNWTDSLLSVAANNSQRVHEIVEGYRFESALGIVASTVLCLSMSARLVLDARRVGRSDGAQGYSRPGSS